MITRINEFQAAPGKEEELFALLNSLIPFISGSKGCISCKVLRDLDSKDKFAVLELWESIQAHKKSLEAFPKEEMEAAMILFGAPPRGSYYK